MENKIERPRAFEAEAGSDAGLSVYKRSASPGQAHATRADTIWEYETFKGNIVGANNPLKELGQQGWELCVFNPKDELYIFKRPKR